MGGQAALAGQAGLAGLPQPLAFTLTLTTNHALHSCPRFAEPKHKTGQLAWSGPRAEASRVTQHCDQVKAFFSG